MQKLAAKPELAKRMRFPAPRNRPRAVAESGPARRKVVEALRAGDKEALRTLVSGELAPLQHEVDRLWKIHREMWLATYRPFGLEVIEGRYMLLLARLQSLADRLKIILPERSHPSPNWKRRC